MLNSLARAIYHTLKAAWYWAFGEPGRSGSLGALQCREPIGPYRCVLDEGHSGQHENKWGERA